MYTKRADRHTYNIPDTIASHLIQPCPNGQVYNVLPDYRPNHIAPQRYIRHFYRFHVIPEVEYVRYKSGCFFTKCTIIYLLCMQTVPLINSTNNGFSS